MLSKKPGGPTFLVTPSSAQFLNYLSASHGLGACFGLLLQTERKHDEIEVGVSFPRQKKLIKRLFAMEPITNQPGQPMVGFDSKDGLDRLQILANLDKIKLKQKLPKLMECTSSFFS